MMNESFLLQHYVSCYIGLIDDCVNQHIQKMCNSLYYFQMRIKKFLLGKFYEPQNQFQIYLDQFKLIVSSVGKFLDQQDNKESDFLLQIEEVFTGGNKIQSNVEHGSDKLLQLPDHVVEKCLSNKKDAYSFQIQKFQVQLYLPNYRQDEFNMKYVKGLLNGTKKFFLRAFKLSEVREITVPIYDEFKMSNVWKQMLTDKKFMQYMSLESEDQIPNRQFFYNIYNTLYPKKLADLIAKAEFQRSNSKLLQNNKKMEINKVEISSESQSNVPGKEYKRRNSRKNIKKFEPVCLAND